jgi:hypothetical protein
MAVHAGDASIRKFLISANGPFVRNEMLISDRFEPTAARQGVNLLTPLVPARRG